MNSTTGQLIIVHFKTFFREPGIIFWSILFPVLMAWILGVAFSSGGEQSKTVYVTGTGPLFENLFEKRDKASVTFSEDIGSPVNVTFIKSSREEAVLALKRGETSLYMQEEDGFFHYFYDPNNPDAQSAFLLLDRELTGRVEVSPVKAVVTPLEAAGTRYIDFLIPGLIAMGIMNSCMWGISYNLIEFRMKKLLRRMLATPMKKSDFLMSHFIFRMIIVGIESLILLLFAIFYFDIALTGSWLAFLLIYISGIVCFTGIAVIIASRTENTQVGNGLINAVILPMTVLSGIFFSYHNFPEFVVPIIKFFPLTLLADNIRAVFIEGAGIVEVLTPSGILLGLGIICYLIGIRVFRWY